MAIIINNTHNPKPSKTITIIITHQIITHQMINNKAYKMMERIRTWRMGGSPSKPQPFYRSSIHSHKTYREPTIHNETKTSIPNIITSINHLGRSFTLDDPNVHQWIICQKKAMSYFKRQLTTNHKKLYPQMNAAQRDKELKNAKDALVANMNALFAKKAAKTLFDPQYYIERQNVSKRIKLYLPRLKRARITLIEADKKMGDVWIPIDIVDDVAYKILSGPEYKVCRDVNEESISDEVRSKTIPIWNHIIQICGKDIMNRKAFKFYRNYINKSNRDPTHILSIPNLRPMQKRHKPKIDWRRVMNASIWHSNPLSDFLQIEVRKIMKIVRIKSCKLIIIDNSIDVISSYHGLNRNDPTFDNNLRIFIDGDVKALYDNMNLNDCIDAIEYLIEKYCENVFYTPRWVCCRNIIMYFIENTYVKYKKMISKMFMGTGTGYKHSGALANIYLMAYEIKNNDSFKRTIKEPDVMQIRANGRYIDDIKNVVDVDLDEFNSDQYEALYFIETVVFKAINDIYPPNIKIVCKASQSTEFLDTFSTISNDSQITTRLFEKKMSRHQALHMNANNPLRHKIGVFQSQLHRAIVLCDKHSDYIDYKKRFLAKMVLRGYTQGWIRLMHRTASIPKYRHRRKYINKQLKKKKIKSLMHALECDEIHCFPWRTDHGVVVEYEEIKQYILKLDPKAFDEDEDIKLYYVQIYQQLFHDECALKNILDDCIEKLPDGFREKCSYIICNKVGDKIRKYLN
eukprot:504256_1